MGKSFSMDSISVIEADHKSYDQLDVSQEETDRQLNQRFYNEVLEVYNEAEVGTILLIPIPPTASFFNLRNVFINRGLSKDDLLITRQQTDPDGELLPMAIRPAKFKKLSERSGRIVDNLNREEDDTG